MRRTWSDNIGKLKTWLTKLEKQIEETNRLANNTGFSMGNFNQKNDIKILDWPENQDQK
jgi:hypothetical protein